jgi:ATP-dependent Clp protease ATP-binding subunit ClpC
MVLDETGLRISSFDIRIATAFGNTPGEEGGRVLAECMKHGRYTVTLRDWLYCLARTNGTEIHKRFVLRAGQDADRFISVIEDSIEEDESDGMLPTGLTSETVNQEVIDFLERAEAFARKRGDRIGDADVSLALLQTADKELTELLETWIEEDQYQIMLRQLERTVKGDKHDTNIFDQNGRLQYSAVSPTARSFLKRVVEDAASLGAKQIGGKHLLYTLLSDETSLLSRTLYLLGVDVKTQMHAPLARQLRRPGRKRCDDLSLDRQHLLETVAKLFEHAYKLASARDSIVLEHDISLAYVQRQEREIIQLLGSAANVDVVTLRETMEDAEPEFDEDEDNSLHQIPISEIERRIKSVICGQEAAIERVLPWIKRLRFGLPRDGRPAGVFLFLGPTGTGKTQLAKELARFVFGDEDALIFLEMGQFKTKESMNMFIGAAPGYVGYGEGKLTNGLAEKPESVVLFDEIEKADTQVFDTLLRFADEGLISDPAGPVRDGRKCLIVMTTNAGQQWLRDELKNNPEVRDTPDVLTERLFEAAMKEMSARGFRPEFLGRVDERITYLPFSETDCANIVNLVLDKEIRKLSELKGVTLEVDDKARKLLADYAYKRSMDEGARGAPRAVNQFVITPMIDLMSDRIDTAANADVVGLRILATRRGFDDEVTFEVSS